MADDTYNGWTNYETWAVKLWIDNEQSTQEYWLEAAGEAWNSSAPGVPNQFIPTHERNAVSVLAERLKTEHDSGIEAVDGTVYADLLNAALSEVNWHEIAESLLETYRENAPAEEETATE